MELIQVKEFNRQAQARYQRAVNNFDYRNGGFPCRLMYIFETEDGEDRRRGYVATEGQKHCFGINEQEATNNFNK